MQATKVILPNKLRLLLVPMPAVESATVTVWTATGSRYENPKISGISHFLEHMVFKGSKNYPSSKIVSEAIDSLGAINNAGTHKEWTNFWAKARVGVIEDIIKILSDIVVNPLLKEEDISREKGVITEEIAMYQDTPMLHIGDIFENLIFKGDQLGVDIIGSKESVKGLTKSNILRYRKLHYHPENMLVTIAGGVETAEAEKLVRKYFGKMKDGGTHQSKPAVTFSQKESQVLLESKPTDQAHLVIGYHGSPRGDKNRYAEAILTTILGSGMSSRLFTEVREKRGLAYAIRSGSAHYIDNGYVETYAGVPPAKAVEAIKVIHQEHLKISKEGEISQDELTKAKEYLKGHLALSLEDTSDVNDFFGTEELMLGKIRTPEEAYVAIDKVTADQVTDLAKNYFVNSKLNLAIIGPYKSPTKFEKLLK